MLELQTLLTALRRSFFSCCLAAKLLKTTCKAAVLSQDSFPLTSLPVCVCVFVSDAPCLWVLCVWSTSDLCFSMCVFVRPDVEIYLPVHVLVFSPPPTGRSSLFPIDDNLLDDGHGNQGVPGVLGSPNCYPHQNGERIERFSRKVFVGGLPPDIDEGEGERGELLRMCSFLSLLLLTCLEIPLHPQMK